MLVGSSLPVDAGLISVLIYLAAVGIVLRQVRLYYPFAVFGAANVITLLRLGLVTILAGFLVPAAPLSEPASAWLALVVAALALALDGIDGRIARWTGLTSPFGARFDMEVDAALIMVLGLLAWQAEKAGIWVLALGLIRYGFRLAGMVLPWLSARLPESIRRKTVCVVQVAVLTLLLAPPLAPPVSEVLALLALTLLIWSFATDIRWLRRNAGVGG